MISILYWISGFAAIYAVIHKVMGFKLSSIAEKNQSCISESNSNSIIDDEFFDTMTDPQYYYYLLDNVYHKINTMTDPKYSYLSYNIYYDCDH
jgi:hypothetical protein